MQAEEHAWSNTAILESAIIRLEKNHANIYHIQEDVFEIVITTFTKFVYTNNKICKYFQ